MISAGRIWWISLLIGQLQLAGIDSLPPLKLEAAYPQLVFDRPLVALSPPAGDERLYVTEQKGRILILPRDRTLNAIKVFFDITERKPYIENEEGLLGFAFHPQFRSNGKFYVYYTQHQPRRSVLSEFQRLATSPDQTDMTSERVLLEIPQPYGNHNSGSLAFGPDGHLYVGLGDGGSANDPHDNAQNLRSLLGKILRLDVNERSGSRGYGIPQDNPFIGQGAGVRPEIWAFGFRNPWGLSFDSLTGGLWVADVGQNRWEEINYVIRGGNYGWNTYEGFHLFKEPASAAVNTIFPVIEYPHSQQFAEQAVFAHDPGLSVTGGHLYRGQRLRGFQGVYFYGDFATGALWGLRFENGKVTHQGTLVPPPEAGQPVRNISGFGRDAAGEIYVLAFDGIIYGLHPISE